MMGKLSRKRLMIIGIVVAVAVLLLALFGIRGCTRNEETQQGSVQDEDPAANRPDSAGLLAKVKSIKSDVKLLLVDLKDGNTESARVRAEAISDFVKDTKTYVDVAVSLTDGIAPSLQKQMKDIQQLMAVADMALTEMLMPGINLMEAHPISELKVGDGFNTRLIGYYLDFADSIMPKVEVVMECVNSIDLSFLDTDGDISKYLALANKLMDFYYEDPEIFSLLKSMLGAEEDRLYVVAVQNPAEIRASGGFPGSIGVMRICDGVLTVGDFQSVAYVLSSSTPDDIKLTNEEWVLFNYLSGMQTPRDADLCPDFHRVGHIWASAYEKMNKEPVSGVVAVSPHIVQRILAATGEEIALFDGLVMNGNNAMEILLHDLYYKYFSTDYVQDRAVVSDDLFADAAKKTMGLITGDVSVSRLLQYVPVVQRSIEDRTLLMWMKGDAEQAFIERLGCDGGLNTDPQNPEAGVYFNLVTPCKLGWNFLMATSMGERTKNEDGSYTYPITVTFANNVSEDDIKSATTYIDADMNGSFRGAAYFFAPAGGTVENFEATNGQTIWVKTYNGLELGFMDMFILRPNQPITITYTVTTAPGVETPLVFSKTPTAQDYYTFYGVG